MENGSPLQVQAYDYLKNMILSGELEQGILYSETRISGQIGISRTPVREALRCLSQDGYILVVPSKGFMVRSLNQQDMKESIQIRCAMEGFCAQMIASEAETEKGRQVLGRLRELLKDQEKVLDTLESFMEYDHQFHRELINYADNQEFQRTFQRLMHLIHLTTAKALSVPGRIQDTLEEHREFYRALEAGEGDGAYRLLMAHLMMPLSMDLAGKEQHV